MSHENCSWAHWAVIPSGFRREMLYALVKQLFRQQVNVVIVDTGYEEGLLEPFKYKLESPGFHLEIIRDTGPKNISRWWNSGLLYVRGHFLSLQTQNFDYIVHVLNDDVVLPYGYNAKLCQVLQENRVMGAYPDQHRLLGPGKDSGVMIFKDAAPISLYARMPGYAFSMRGSAKLYADEDLQWWFGDDDLDWRIRQNGGNALVGGLQVEHLSPNLSTVGELAEQAGRDRQTFKDKWGKTPW